MWIIIAGQRISPEMTVKGFKKCQISSIVDETDDDILWNGSEEDGNVRVSVRKMQTLTVNTDTVILIDRGRQNQILSVY